MSSISIQEYRSILAAGTRARPAGARVRRRALEEDLHRACVEWLQLKAPAHPILRWAIHVPNGGKRSKGEAGKLKAMGVKPGVPDILLPRPYRGWNSLAIELKSPTGPVSAEQQSWLDALEEDGGLVAVCRSIDEFEAVVYRFLGGRA